MKNPYHILGLAQGATPEEIKSAYRRLSVQCHPDRNPAPEAHAKFAELSEAYQALSDPIRRRAIDHQISKGLVDNITRTVEGAVGAYLSTLAR